MRLFLSFILLCWGAFAFSQTNAESLKSQYYDIHEYTISGEGKNPLLQTGVYFENKYVNAIGHPYIFADAFYNGDVVFKNREYTNVKLKYDIFNQHLYINHKTENSFISNMLADEFISEFSIIGLRFVPMKGTDGQTKYYQVIADEPYLSCYSQWYKDRSESMEGAYKKEVFGDSKQRRFLLMNNKMLRFNKNRSFIKLLPKNIATSVKKFLKENDIEVNKAEYEKMNELIIYCNELLAELNIGIE